MADPDTIDDAVVCAESRFDLMQTIVRVDPKRLRVEQSAPDGLVLHHEEWGEVRGAAVRPCFPVTRPERFLMLHHADGAELGVLEDLEDLDKESAEALRVELTKQHFVPVITKVDAIYTDFQIPIWEVQTDHGPRRLALRSGHDAHRLAAGRIYVRDADGNAYLIPDYQDLDEASQALIDLHM